MKKATPFTEIEPVETSQDVLTQLARQGAQKMLAVALEDEVARYVDHQSDERDDAGRRLVVRNGRSPEREIQTGLGGLAVRQPRVNDRRVDEDGRRIKFTSKILPPYLRRTKAIEELIPWLYLKGVSTGDFTEALAALLGKDAPGLSASTVVRLKQVWETDYKGWSRRDLSGKRYVYVWADGIHFNIRLEEHRQCILVVMGATADGKKELIAVQDGYRESEQSWKELLLDLKARGLDIDPELAVGDGALGFWKALAQVWPSTRVQRCWCHKTANVMNNLPKSEQPRAKDALHQIWMAGARDDAHSAFALFVETYAAKFPKATACLEKDKDELLAFYDFPAEHWKHLRTTNPIESTFATVRLRTKRTKGSGSRIACMTMVFKLAQAAERKWRKLDGHQLLGDVIRGVQFKDGTKVAA
ncbi:MAG: IS256 family transposase [Planctomycetota bacterium]|jgi:transposase-like protein|nr:IS256 family transposase [Planctomycetota bacterium]